MTAEWNVGTVSQYVYTKSGMELIDVTLEENPGAGLSKEEVPERARVLKTNLDPHGVEPNYWYIPVVEGKDDCYDYEVKWVVNYDNGEEFPIYEYYLSAEAPQSEEEPVTFHESDDAWMFLKMYKEGGLEYALGVSEPILIAQAKWVEDQAWIARARADYQSQYTRHDHLCQCQGCSGDEGPEELGDSDDPFLPEALYPNPYLNVDRPGAPIDDDDPFINY